MSATKFNKPVDDEIKTLNDQIGKQHFYKTTISAKVHTSDGALYRSSGKNYSVNSSNVLYASVTVVNATYDCWACIVSVEDNKVRYVIESSSDINTDTDFTVYIMTVDA